MHFVCIKVESRCNSKRNTQYYFIIRMPLAKTCIIQNEVRMHL